MLSRKAMMAAPATVPLYIEDVFSTYLYTGNGSTQTITNGIDLSGEGGLVWTKVRTFGGDHCLNDSERNAFQNRLVSNATGAQDVNFSSTEGVTSALSNGFIFKSAYSSPNTYVSWTFRKAPKFFDVVTYTGNGVARTIAHNLGSVPGMIIVKSTSAAANWIVYHRSTGNNYSLILNNTEAASLKPTWNNTTPTSTVFSVGEEGWNTNNNGVSYVAYLFAHDAGGFGEAGDQNVVSCGSFTGTGAFNLGWEPQLILLKNAAEAGNWRIVDNMRGWSMTNGMALNPNLSDAEVDNFSGFFPPTPTGFINNNFGSGTYIYLAIRRGPMKKPTSGTSVFGLNARTGTGANATVTGGQTDDAVIIKNRGSAVGDLFAARLTGTRYLETSSTAAEVAAGTTILQANPWDVMDGVKVGTTSTITNASSNTFINYLFRRAPGFFDVVCYRGNGSTQNVSHNLTVAPNLIIVKNRGAAGTDWLVYSSAFPTVSGNPPENLYLLLNGTGGISTTGAWNYTAPTASVFSVAGGNNESANNYVAYLFATLPGVSKVGSYTGTGTTQQINCGFTTGARFVLIRRTDFGTNNWFVWDTARGISTSNDPYLLLNSTAAEVTNTDYIDPLASGFEISSTASAEINANGGTFIYLAIA